MKASAAARNNPFFAALVAAAVGLAAVSCQSLLGTPSDSPALSAVEGSGQSEAVLSFPDISQVPREEPTEPDYTAQAQQIVATWPITDQIASLFLIHVPGQNLADFQGAVEEHPVAGVLLLTDNVSRDAQLAAGLTGAIRRLGTPDLLVALDQEGGGVERIRSDDLPSAPQLGQGEATATTEATRARNELVFDLGGNVNFGVVADVSPGEGAYIDSRSFGEDPQRVSAHVSAAVAGSLDGVATAIKHFPGHGLTELDTHRDFAVSEVSEGEWRRVHAPAFRAGIEQGAPLVMVSHVVVPSVEAVPASLSPEWISLLRGELGFQGVVVSDDLSMLEATGADDYRDFAQNAVLSVAAGVDLIVDAGAQDPEEASQRVADAITAISRAIDDGIIDPRLIESAAVRVLALRLSLGGVARPLENAEVGELGG